MKIIKGNTVEEQIKYIDKILKSYSYRLHKTVSGIITPVPVSNYSESSDIVLRYMFPISGRLTIGEVFIEELPASGVNIEINVFNGPLHDSKSIFSKKKTMAVIPDFEVFPGTRLIVKVLPTNIDEIASGIWTAFLWTPEVKNTEIKHFLINDLEKIGKENALC